LLKKKFAGGTAASPAPTVLVSGYARSRLMLPHGFVHCFMMKQIFLYFPHALEISQNSGICRNSNRLKTVKT